jgi:hypothetical protein
MVEAAEQTIQQFVENKIEEIHAISNVSVDDLRLEYKTIFDDPFIQHDDQFKTDEERHRYAIATLWARYVGRPPLFTTKLIPIGLSPKQTSKKGSEFANLFAITPDGKLHRVLFQGELAQQLSQVNLFCGYEVKLGRFKGSEDFICDVRSKWENPLTLEKSPEEIMALVVPKKLQISRLADFPSKMRADGYVDNLDWRGTRGLIWRKNDGVRKDGSKWQNYVIGDQDTKEPRITKDGTVLPVGFTVWVDELFFGFSVEDECDFFGPVKIDKSGVASMTAFTVLPVHTRRPL